MEKVQFIKTPGGEEMAVIPKGDYEAMVKALADVDEDAADVAIYDARKAELAETGSLPPEISMAILKGESRLRAIRKHKGYSQMNLAEAVNVGQGYISDIEGGRRPMSAIMLKNLSEALDVPAAWLEGE